MAKTNTNPADRTSDPVDATVDELAELYEDTHRSTGWVQRIANRATRMLGMPASLTVVFGLVIAWMAINSAGRLFGYRELERFPFPALEFVATVAALLTTLLILTTQRHEEEVAEKRDRLTLQIAVLSEKKIAKVIALLEEQRRDNPSLPTRRDDEAATMASATDARESLRRLEDEEARRGPD